MSVNVAQMIGHKKIHELIWIEPEKTVLEGLQLMEKYNIGALAVIKHGLLEGIFSERDNARKVEIAGRTAATTLIRDIMTPRAELRTVWVETDLEYCLFIMDQDGIRHLPVLHGEGEYERVVGMISEKDIVHELIDRKTRNELDQESIRSNAR